MKAGYGITKAIGEHQQKRAKKISDKRWRDYMSGKRKSYGGESFNCSLMQKRINKIRGVSSVIQFIMHCGSRGKRRRKQRGGIIPLILMAGKALLTGAISSGAKYGVKKALEKRKKKVGKISAAQWAANKRRVQRMLTRAGLPGLRTLRHL